MKYQIRPFSSYNNWTVTADTDNVSSIADKLVRLAAKCTDYFAGDIYFTINRLCRCVDGGHSLDILLLFRGGGVNEYDMTGESEIERGDHCYLPRCIQLWRLTHDPVTTNTKLVRVTASADFGNDYVGGDT